MKDQGRGPATYVVPWAPHLLNWALTVSEYEQTEYPPFGVPCVSHDFNAIFEVV